MKLGHVALDGTMVRANASKHKAMSYGRMKEKEGQLSAEVAELLRRAGEVDDDETGGTVKTSVGTSAGGTGFPGEPVAGNKGGQGGAGGRGPGRGGAG